MRTEKSLILDTFTPAYRLHGWWNLVTHINSLLGKKLWKIYFSKIHFYHRVDFLNWWNGNIFMKKKPFLLCMSWFHQQYSNKSNIIENSASNKKVHYLKRDRVCKIKNEWRKGCKKIFLLRVKTLVLLLSLDPLHFWHRDFGSSILINQYSAIFFIYKCIWDVLSELTYHTGMS